MPAANLASRKIRSSAFEELARIDICENLSEDERRAMYIHMELVHRATGENILREGENSNKLYCFVDGFAVVSGSRPGMPAMSHNLVGPGDSVGEFNYNRRSGHTASVIAHTSCWVLEISCDAMRALAVSIPALSDNINRLGATRAAFMTKITLLRNSNSQAGFLAVWFLIFAEKWGVPQTDGSVVIPIPFTQAQLAAFVPTDRPKVSKILGRFRNEKIIALSAANRWVILDRNGLANFDKIYAGL